MKKAQQRAINTKVEHELDWFKSVTHAEDIHKIMQLRTCKATVFDAGRYLVLKSYDTVVAIIKKGRYDLVRHSTHRKICIEGGEIV